MAQLQGRYFLLVIFVVTFMMSLSGEGFPLRTDKKKPSLKLSPLDGTVAHFTIIGDYGRQGADNQLEVAQQMANWCTNVAPNCDFTIGVGDNFYPSGVSGVHDSQFQSSFEDIYRPRGAFGSQFYNAFGNHEYYGYAHAEVEYSLRYNNGEKHSSKFYLPNEYYARVISVGDLNILLAVFDTSPMIESYYSSQKVNMTALVLQKDINRQLVMMQQSIDALSRENQISFKLAVGHHPIKSAGKHGDNADISNKLEPFLQKNGFYVYLSGHDHNLQYLSGFDCNGNNCMHQIISGGGSKVHKYEIDPNHPGLKYYLEESAFTAVQLTKSMMSVSFINHKGHVKAQFDIKNPTP